MFLNGMEIIHNNSIKYNPGVIIMDTIIIDETMVEMFKEHLRLEEKSENTIEKYVRDVRAFCNYVNGRTVSKEITIEYKQALLEKGYAVRSINSMIASLNSFFLFISRTDLIIKTIKEQHQLFFYHYTANDRSGQYTAKRDSMKNYLLLSV